MASSAPISYYPIVIEPPAYRPARLVPLLLVILTLLTTMVVGARLEFNFLRDVPAYRTNTDLLPFLWIWRHPGYLLLGLPFALALMGIFLAHEFGHYLACRHYGLDATLPYFLPAPTLIGTLGACILIRSPFRERRELFDVGIAGPLAGFALAVPILIFGLLHSGLRADISGTGALQFNWPLLMILLLHFIRPGWTASMVALSPLARAAWVGLLATMLNLIPSGQLDGGHIVYTFFPRLHRWVGWAMIALTAWMGWRFWSGWYFWAVLLLVMRARHPPVPTRAPIGRTRVVLALVALAILALTFLPAPFLFR